MFLQAKNLKEISAIFYRSEYCKFRNVCEDIIFVNSMPHEFKVYTNKILTEGFKNACESSGAFKNSIIILK